MLTQYAFSILFIDKKKAKFSNDRFGFMLNINDTVYDEHGDVLDSMIETGGMSKE